MMPESMANDRYDSDWQIKNNPYFCILPFTHLHVGTTGAANLCCVARYDQPVEQDVTGKDLAEIWRGQTYQKIRSDMLDGLPQPRCAGCYKIDATGGGSDRQTYNLATPNVWLDEIGGTQSALPVTLDIRPGRTCNFKCRMCWSNNSSSIMEELQLHPGLASITGDNHVEIQDWFGDHSLYGSLQRIIPQVELIKLAGGEPLFMPDVVRFIDWCVSSGNTHLTLDITTNGSRIRGKVIRWLDHFAKSLIQLSIDGIGYTNDYIRHGAVWHDLDSAYRFYLAHPKTTVSIMSTVQIYNAYDLPNILRYWINAGCNHNLIFNPVRFPQDLDIKLLPLADREEIAAELDEMSGMLDTGSRQRSRIDHVLALLHDTAQDPSLHALRKNWAVRTKTFDKIRGESINNVHAKLAEYCDLWLH